jgi:ElaB/YqjD/DUF883 family membrane-anchored ribosome-binding protein
MGTIASLAVSALRRRAENTADAVRDSAHRRSSQVADASSYAQDRFGGVLDDLQDLISRAQKVSGREFTSLRQQMSKTLDTAGGTLGALSGDAAVVARRTLAQTSTTIRSHPMKTVGVVAVVGLLIGFLVASRRQD